MLEAHDTTYWLDKASEYEDKLIAGEASKRKAANIAFRAAMRLDGHPEYREDII